MRRSLAWPRGILAENRESAADPRGPSPERYGHERQKGVTDMKLTRSQARARGTNRGAGRPRSSSLGAEARRQALGDPHAGPSPP